MVTKNYLKNTSDKIIIFILLDRFLWKVNEIRESIWCIVCITSKSLMFSWKGWPKIEILIGEIKLRSRTRSVFVEIIEHFLILCDDLWGQFAAGHFVQIYSPISYQLCVKSFLKLLRSLHSKCWRIIRVLKVYSMMSSRSFFGISSLGFSLPNVLHSELLKHQPTIVHTVKNESKAVGVTKSDNFFSWMKLKHPKKQSFNNQFMTLKSNWDKGSIFGEISYCDVIYVMWTKISDSHQFTLQNQLVGLILNIRQYTGWTKFLYGRLIFEKTEITDQNEQPVTLNNQ